MVCHSAFFLLVGQGERTLLYYVDFFPYVYFQGKKDGTKAALHIFYNSRSYRMVVSVFQRPETVIHDSLFFSDQRPPRLPTRLSISSSKAGC